MGCVNVCLVHIVHIMAIKGPVKGALTPFGEAQGMLREPQGERFPVNSSVLSPRSS
jgi:hypothetical protein